MPGPSSSQELDFECFALPVSNTAPVLVFRRVLEGLHKEVSEAFGAAPHRSPETGGILLGRREGDRIIVEDFEPVPSEHRFGPSYRLSDADCDLLRETLQWFRSGEQPGLTVLGFYRSHTVPDFALCPQDEELMRGYFGPDEDLILLVKPGLMGFNAEDFSIQVANRADPASPAVTPTVLWPAPRPRFSTEPEPRKRRRWPWYAAAIALGLAGGAFGYYWLHPETISAGHLTVAAPTPPPVAASLEPAVEGVPAPPGPDIAGIHSLLDRWSSALKGGDVQMASLCYAPVVSTYFTRHDVSREAVRQSLRHSRDRYGRLEIYRISGLSVIPVSEDRAVATFHKRWKTSGRSRSAGEEDERMTLVRAKGQWQISSEQTR